MIERHRLEAAVEVILRAIEKAGYRPGEDVALALDPATTELVEEGSGGDAGTTRYVLAREGRTLESGELIDLWDDWSRRYPLASLEDAALAEVERVRESGVEPSEILRAKRQLRARLVFENDSVTHVAHQLGYFETVAGPGFFPRLQECIDAVTPEQVWDVARRRLGATSRTVGWFRPLEPGR